MTTTTHRPGDMAVPAVLCLVGGLLALVVAFFMWAVERPGSPWDTANYAPAIALAVVGAVLLVVSAVLHVTWRRAQG